MFKNSKLQKNNIHFESCHYFYSVCPEALPVQLLPSGYPVQHGGRYDESFIVRALSVQLLPSGYPVQNRGRFDESFIGRHCL